MTGSSSNHCGRSLIKSQHIDIIIGKDPMYWYRIEQSVRLLWEGIEALPKIRDNQEIKTGCSRRCRNPPRFLAGGGPRRQTLPHLKGGWVGINIKSDRLRAQVRKPGMFLAGLEPEYGDDSLLLHRLNPFSFLSILTVLNVKSSKFVSSRAISTNHPGLSNVSIFIP